MTQKITSYLLSIALLVSCISKQVDSNIIRVNDAKQVKLNLSDYVLSLEYVPLETKKECLIDRDPSFYVLDEYIVATTMQQCFLFNRNGKFIREIGRPGRGPDEYSSTLRGEIVNEQTQTILLQGWDKRIEYSFDGTVTKNFPKIPDSSTESAYVSDSILVQGIHNFIGNATNQLIFYNQEKVVDSIPNYQFFTPMDPNAFGGFGVEFSFYRYRDELYYKNIYNDTIFRFQDKKLHPVWIFDMEQYHLPRSVMANMNTIRQETVKYNRLLNLWETDPFILFSIIREKGDSAFVFDKRKHQVFVMSKEQKLKGFHNDLDGGMPFWPIRINQKQEMISFLYPNVMKEMLTNEYFEQKNIRNSYAHLRLKELLNMVKEDDNPVVVIARLKL